MTHTFKLARRISRLRAAPLASLLLVFACSGTESFAPTTPEEIGVSFATAGSSLTISNLSVQSGKTYQVASSFATGARIYTDRDYTIQSSIPGALQGVTYIRTANDDKNTNHWSSDFLSFTISESAVVYVAHDDRVALPSWLGANFQNTGADLVSPSGDTRYSLFRRSYPSGKVTLGGNGASVSSSSMYFVLVEPIAAPLTVSNLSARSGKTYRVDTDLSTGSRHYIDRSYAAASIPSGLAGATYIQTANDDKNAYAGNTSFLSFDISDDADVYVGHDNRLARPSWLTSNFQDTGMDLLSSDPATRFSLFKRTFAAGRITLGSNVTSASDASMYVVLIQPASGSGTPSAPVVVSDGDGIPFGTAGVPSSEFAGIWSGGLHHLSPGNSALSFLAEAKKHKARTVISLAGGRETYKNSDGTFSLTKWKSNVSAWRSVNIAPYIADGTIVGHYLIDEPNWQGSWGGRPVSRSELQEMTRYSKALWPDMPTTIRVSADYLLGYSWPDLDFAWAQWEGPLRAKMSPEAWRDKEISLAKQLGLKLLFGLNSLDGGDGSSGIPGTYDLRIVNNRWQMSAAEIEKVGKVFAAASYACAIVNWRWSPDYPAASYLTSSQLSLIRAFDSRSDVKTAYARVAEVAKNRPTMSCKRGV